MENRSQSNKNSNASLAQPCSLDMNQPIHVIENVLEALLNSYNTNILTQEYLLDFDKSKVSVTAKRIKQVYRILTQNKANQIYFQKIKDQYQKLNFQNEESIFRLYVRLIEKITQKISYYIMNRKRLAFLAPYVLKLVKRLQILTRRVSHFKELSFICDTISSLFVENIVIEQKIYEVLVEKGYLSSMQEYFRINGIDLQCRDIYNSNIQGKQYREEPVQNSIKHSNFMFQGTRKKIPSSANIKFSKQIINLKNNGKSNTLSIDNKANEINQQIEKKFQEVITTLISPDPKQPDYTKQHQPTIQQQVNEDAQTSSIASKNNQNFTVRNKKLRVSQFYSQQFETLTQKLREKHTKRYQSQNITKLAKSEMYELINNSLLSHNGFRNASNKKTKTVKADNNSMTKLLRTSIVHKTQSENLKDDDILSDIFSQCPTKSISIRDIEFNSSIDLKQFKALNQKQFHTSSSRALLELFKDNQKLQSQHLFQNHLIHKKLAVKRQYNNQQVNKFILDHLYSVIRSRQQVHQSHLNPAQFSSDLQKIRKQKSLKTFIPRFLEQVIEEDQIQQQKIKNIEHKYNYQSQRKINTEESERSQKALYSQVISCRKDNNLKKAKKISNKQRFSGIQLQNDFGKKQMILRIGTYSVDKKNIFRKNHTKEKQYSQLQGIKSYHNNSINKFRIYDTNRRQIIR